MHRKGVLIALGLIILLTDGFSQELSHQVMVPAAGVVMIGGNHFTQTIGEPAVTILIAENYLLTQGYQQPRVRLILGPKPSGNGVNAYPNPMTEVLWLELFGDNSTTFIVSIITIYGTEVYREELSFTGQFWYKDYRPVTHLKPGLYFVRFMTKDGKINRAIKVEKM